MKRQTISLLLASFALAFAGPVAAAGTTGIFASAGADGSVELSNLAVSDDAELVVAAGELSPAQAPATANAAGLSPIGRPPREQPSDTAGTATGSVTIAATETTPLSLNEQYRNHVQQQMHGVALGAQNPAVSRRYLMQSRPQLASSGR